MYFLNLLLFIKSSKLSTSNNIIPFRSYYQALSITLRKNDALVDHFWGKEIINYDNFHNYKYNITNSDGYVDFYLESSPESLEEAVKNITSSIISKNKIFALFRGFTDHYSIIKNAKNFRSDKVEMWDYIMQYPHGCLWDYEMDYLDEYNDLLETTDWKKICFNRISFFHYDSNDQPNKGKIVFISFGQLIAIVCAILLAAVLVTLSLCFIAYRRYIHYDKSSREYSV